MKEINLSDIPKHLKQQFDEENALMRKIIHDQSLLTEYGTVHVVSFDIIKHW